MKYQRKAVVVDAFRFGPDAEMIAPKWFIKAVRNEVISIDRSIKDGSVHVYGCTIETCYGKMHIKNGDYIIRDRNGGIMLCKGREFQRQYERMKHDGS